MSSRPRISSPLEAGPSLLATHHLPSHLTSALEYASKRLSRKAQHLTLVVVRKDYQLRSSVPPSPYSPYAPYTPSTPASPSFATAPLQSPSRITSPFRGFLRRGNSVASLASSITSEAPSVFSSASQTQWPQTPCSLPPTPHTPSSVVTYSTMASHSDVAFAPSATSEFGIRLIYSTPLTPKEEKNLRSIFARAEAKYGLSANSLPVPTTATSCGLNADLIRRSLIQNEVLFSSEGLTLLGLDRLYTFKSALASYGRSIGFHGSSGGRTTPGAGMSYGCHGDASPTPIEEAVDALRRLVLANGGRQITKSDLHRSYDWIGVHAQALSDVERMYRRAYGGVERKGAFEVTAAELGREWELKKRLEEEERERGDVLGLALVRGVPKDDEIVQRPVVKIGLPPGPKTPALRLKTDFSKDELKGAQPKLRTVASVPVLHKPQPKAQAPAPAPAPKSAYTEDVHELTIKLDDLTTTTDDDGDDDNDGDLTARPVARGTAFWAGSSIDEVLSNLHMKREEPEPIRLVIPGKRESHQSQHQGPMTPNGYDDISPVTRGEWGFLFSGDGWNEAKTAAVETW